MSQGSLRSYDGSCHGNVTLKYNFALSFKVFCDYSMLDPLCKISEVYFRLFGTNGFHVKAKNKRFTASSWCYRQNLKYENLRSSLRRQTFAPKSVPHVQHDYFSSFNQSNHWLVALPLWLLKLGGGNYIQVSLRNFSCHQRSIIRPCHNAAILLRESKKALFYHAKPHPHVSHCEALRGETKLFWSPGTIWPPCDKGEFAVNLGIFASLNSCV